jgi:hypothetical protein
MANEARPELKEKFSTVYDQFFIEHQINDAKTFTVSNVKELVFDFWRGIDYQSFLSPEDSPSQAILATPESFVSKEIHDAEIAMAKSHADSMRETLEYQMREKFRYKQAANLWKILFCISTLIAVVAIHHSL